MSDESTMQEEHLSEETVEDLLDVSDTSTDEIAEAASTCSEGAEGETTPEDEPIDSEMGLSDEEEFAYKIVRAAAKLNGVRIDRNTFLRTELIKHCPASVVDAAVETTTQQAGVSMEIMDKVADDAIDLETKKVAGLSALAGIPGGLAMLGTVPADLINYFAHVLRVEQKIAYAYGWPSFFGEDDEIDDETMYKLILFLGVIMQVGGINVSLTSFAAHTAAVGIAKTIEKQALTKTFWYPILKKVMGAIGVKVTKSSFAKVVSKGVPIVGGLISGGLTWATFKPGATSLKNHLRLLPQATGGVVDEDELEALLNAEDEREEQAREDLLSDAKDNVAAFAGSAAEGATKIASSAVEGATWLAGNAAGAAQSVASAVGGRIAGFAALFGGSGDSEAQADDESDEEQLSEEPSLATEAAKEANGPDSSPEPNEPAPTSPEPAGSDIRPISEEPMVQSQGAPAVTDIANELRVLKGLLDDGIISQADFDAKKAHLLGL